MESEYHGVYKYKGFVIWNSGEKVWIAEPESWSIEAGENLKYTLPRHSTITKAKKWIRETGIHLKEEDYL